MMRLRSTRGPEGLEDDALDRAPKPVVWDHVFERDLRGSLWIKGRACAALIYLGWTLVMFAALTSEDPKNFSGICATIGGWLAGIGCTAGIAWIVRKAD